MRGRRADRTAGGGGLPPVLVAVASRLRPQVLSLLEQAAVSVVTAETGEEAVRAVYERRPGLLLIGTELDGLSPWHVVPLVREMAGIPVTVLDEVYSPANAQRAFGLGAGNYLAWPLPPEVIEGRLHHLLGEQARSGPPDGSAVTDDGWLRVDPARREASAGGHPLELTALEFDLLMQLARHPGQVLTYERLLETAWRLAGEAGGPARVKAAAGRLRRRIESATGTAPAPITTVRGLGLRYTRPET
ncbi:response regulator transcription factor [Streptacidiphilus jiangxiensis]|uniref:Two-component system, OmpR family, alkaline phosphatase synthesis response regulator PhoP n=1 Tax=Streptacidiphilus jiangxiensis TaxID=235985 RepID=A0A1H7NA80_STRJI|nr:response regulator transcription factor [Streptacidiphilus jiangxiensis]SEL19845.1 two-component system, OmpR family, alkaline phosphatase synthesis response regulator PhoP [Streptacidiphilus jiangxiensis]